MSTLDSRLQTLLEKAHDGCELDVGMIPPNMRQTLLERLQVEFPASFQPCPSLIAVRVKRETKTNGESSTQCNGKSWTKAEDAYVAELDWKPKKRVPNKDEVQDDLYDISGVKRSHRAIRQRWRELCCQENDETK